MKGKSDWTDVFVVCGFELYGYLEQQTEKKGTEVETLEVQENFLFNPQKEGKDGKLLRIFFDIAEGAISSLGGYPTVQVYASSVATGKYVWDFISKVNFHS